MDIRNYFGAKPKNGEKNGSNDRKETKKRPKPVALSSSDSEDELKKEMMQNDSKRPKKKAAARPVISSSDSDNDFVDKPPTKNAKEPNKKENLKPVNPNDFFANAKPRPTLVAKAECTKKKEETKKRKVSGDEFHSDPDFEAMLSSIPDDDKLKDTNNAKPSPHKKSKIEDNNHPDSPTKIIKAKTASQTSPKRTVSSPKTNNGNSKIIKRKDDVTSISKPKVKVETKLELKKKSPVKKDDLKGSIKVEEDPKTVSKAVKPMEIFQDTSDATAPSELWVDKYKPKELKQIIGQQTDKSNVKKLLYWLRNWPKNNLEKNGGKRPQRPFHAHNDDGAWAKAALLSGPPGVGKTTTSYLVAKELGLDIMELNASDTRSKKMLTASLQDTLSNKSLAKHSQNRILLMDEVDGMAGNEDRGGMAELIGLIKTSKIPVICMCNDRNHPKIRSLANYTFDLRFHRPNANQIKAAMMSICFKENIKDKISPQGLTELIEGCNQDIRQVLHHLSMLKGQDTNKADGTGSNNNQNKAHDSVKKTSIKIGPWDVVRKVFSSSDKKDMSLMDKSDLFFHDYSIGPLFVQENYLLAVPHQADHDKKKTMLCTSKAADSICMGDLVERTIRSNNAWSLLPTQAMFSSVIPGEYMSGHVGGKIEFPQWLGKYSRQNKFDRMLQELQVHTRMSAGLAKSSLNLDYVQHLKDQIVRPMKTNGQDGVQDSVKAMDFYKLLREDLDNLLEITTWPNQPDPMKSIESKVKAAFTRSYNKDVILPYAKVGNVAKKAKEAVPTAGLNEDEDEQEVDDDEDDDTIANDAMIKAKKPTAKKTEKKAATEVKGKGRGKKSNK